MDSSGAPLGPMEPDGPHHDSGGDEGLLVDRHVSFLARLLKVMPSSLCSMETSRMTVAFFAISGIDVLRQLDKIMMPHEVEATIDWVYRRQVPFSDRFGDSFCHGFRGCSFLRLPKDHDCKFAGPGDRCRTEGLDGGHLAMTYTALALLLILGDDLSRVDRKSISEGLRKLQNPDGSFLSSPESSESDMRFVYCACAIAHMISDWSGVDVQSTVSFIIRSLNYDGAFGQGPQLESHGGSTYCALAALSLMGKLDEALSKKQKEKLTRWCIFRIDQGFHGRPNKADDTCYTFWIGASLKLLAGDCDKVMSAVAAKSREFVLSTQDVVIGGMGKWPSTTSDPLHTYLGLAGISLFWNQEGREELHEVDPALNMSVRAKQHLESLWRRNSAIAH